MPAQFTASDFSYPPDPSPAEAVDLAARMVRAASTGEVRAALGTTGALVDAIRHRVVDDPATTDGQRIGYRRHLESALDHLRKATAIAASTDRK